MEISDYIPNYPEINDPEFNDKIFHKKEFYDLKTGQEIIPFGKPGDLFPHQQMLARFLSPFTPYNELLLFHSVGTGKTCSASAIVEINKQSPLVRKPVLIIVPNDNLANQWRQQIALVCTAGEYVPENYFTSKLSENEKIVRVNKLLKPIYQIITIEKMRRQIEKYKNSPILKNKYSNTIIIIDEAHNLRIQTNTTSKNVKESKGRYQAFHEFLHKVQNSKILLLTGTPMFDNVTELAGIMNLILPLDQQLSTETNFRQQFIKQHSEGITVVDQDFLLQTLTGRVSYFREGGNFPVRVDLGETRWTNYIKTSPLKMSALQAKGYQKAYAKDQEKQEEGGAPGLSRNSRQAIVFVYKAQDSEEYLWGVQALNLLVEKKSTQTLVIKGKKIKQEGLKIRQKYHKDLKENLRNYSEKFQFIVDFCQEHPREAVFVFTPNVSGTGGAIFLGLVLELFGYRKALGNESKPGKRYAIITGDDKSGIQRKALIDIFNSQENQRGELIQIMIGTKAIAEGTNFLNVRHEIIMSPYWNNSGIEQALGRGIRANSLLFLKEDRQITVQQLLSYSDNIPVNENIDIRMYQLSEVKDVEIKMIERILKTAAWDCPFNYARNVRDNDVDGSRSCDYQDCNYSCFRVPPTKTEPKWTYSLPAKDLVDTTFLLYYSDKVVSETVKRIKALLQREHYIDLSGLASEINTDNLKILVLAVNFIMENNVILYNKWGQTCFLCNEKNVLFLSQLPNENKFTSSWYTTYPFANYQVPLTQVVTDEIINSDLAKLRNFVPSKEGGKIIKDLNIETQIFILEYLLKLDSKKMTSQQKKLYRQFRKLFEDHIFKPSDTTIVHDLEKLKMSLNYVDYTKGENGVLRCLQGNEWYACSKKEEDEFSSFIKKEKDTATEIDLGLLQETEEPSDIYGIVTTDKKFQIVDKTKEQQTLKMKKEQPKDVDNRTKYTGRVCKTWKKIDLVKLFLQLNVPVDISRSPVDKKVLLTTITKAKIDAIIPKNANLQDLQKMYVLGRMTIEILCQKLQDFFKEKNLLVKQ